MDAGGDELLQLSSKPGLVGEIGLATDLHVRRVAADRVLPRGVGHVHAVIDRHGLERRQLVDPIGEVQREPMAAGGVEMDLQVDGNIGVGGHEQPVVGREAPIVSRSRAIHPLDVQITQQVHQQIERVRGSPQ